MVYNGRQQMIGLFQNLKTIVILELLSCKILSRYTIKILPYVNFSRVRSDKILIRSYKIIIQFAELL